MSTIRFWVLSEGISIGTLLKIEVFYNRNAEKRFTGQYKTNQMLSGGDVIMGVTDMTQERRLVGHVALVPDMGEKMIFSMDLIKITPKLTDSLFLYSALHYGGLSKQRFRLTARCCRRRRTPSPARHGAGRRHSFGSGCFRS